MGFHVDVDRRARFGYQVFSSGAEQGVVAACGLTLRTGYCALGLLARVSAASLDGCMGAVQIRPILVGLFVTIDGVQRLGINPQSLTRTD